MTDTTMHDETAHDAAHDATVEPVAIEQQSDPAPEAPAKIADTLKDSAGRYGTQAADKAREYADMGKQRATGVLDQLSQMLTDVAAQVDERLGAQYGEYARGAAGQVSRFAEQIKAKDTDAIVDDARDYVRKSPAVAIGIAAALGFVVARLAQSGFDADSGRGDA